MKFTKLFLTVILVGGLSNWTSAQRGGGHHGGELGRPVVDVQQQMKIRASQEQATQLRTCVSVSERLRMLAADLTQPGRLSESDWVKAHQRWNEVLSQALQIHHQAFLKSLNADQRSGLNARLRQMDKTWSELSSRLATVDRDLATAAPDAKSVSGHAKGLKKSLKKWEKQHREVGSEMGIES